MTWKETGGSANITQYSEDDSPLWAEVCANTFQMVDGALVEREMPTFSITVHKTGVGEIGRTVYGPRRKMRPAKLAPEFVGELVKKAMNETLGVTIAKLTEPQKKMLITAAKTRQGRAFIQTGQASTAKKLQEKNLGGYVSDGYEAKFYIWARGIEIARELDPDAVEWGENLRRKYGENLIPNG